VKWPPACELLLTEAVVREPPIRGDLSTETDGQLLLEPLPGNYWWRHSTLAKIYIVL
jgi:hypothetical protein